ncbi:MAG: hypothetical protein WCD76_05455 [Pyrinomonadaceae bacterium]
MKTMMSVKRASHLALLLLCVAATSAVVRADVKIKSRQTTQGQTYENATYIKGKRQSSEQMGGQMVSIQQCDLRRDLQLMPQAKIYTVTPYADADANTTPVGDARSQSGPTKGGLVTSTVTSRDTGERKQMFGYTARHIITTIVTESSPDSCTPMNSKMETDGWYIDVAFQLDCDRERNYTAYRPQQQKSGCHDRYQLKQVGAAKKGYALWEKMTMFGDDGRESFSMINEVVELSQASLDAALFDAPADYREVKDFSGASLMASSAVGGDAEVMNQQGNAGTASASPALSSGMSAGVKSMASAGGARDAGEVGAKKPGMIRLGLASVKTGSVGEGLSASDLAAAVGNTLAEYLKSPNVELIQLEAKLPSQLEAEARQKECDFIVYSNVSHKKGGGGGFGGMFGKVMAPAVGQVGIGHTGSTAGNVAGAVATNAIVNAGTMSANVKPKDELTLDIRVQAPGSPTAATSRQFKSKAKSAGEDIITPLIEQAAQMILDAAIKA